MSTFKAYCVECSKKRVPGSSNAKFDFDYCTQCKKITNFSLTPLVKKDGAGGAAKKNAALQEEKEEEFEGDEE